MNRLANSLSPYLLQHQNNPVDWFPWGEEAFEIAKERDLPIFLSVGYAACHWCHVMEHESFENAEIASFLNSNFVSVKVDREERPDIDQIYMNAVQVMTGRGGWPMSVFLDHERRPFYAGTYWPPQQKFGMPGFPQVLDALVDAWKNRREEVLKHCGQITGALSQLAIGTNEVSPTIPPASLVDEAGDKLLGVLDRKDGGFGAAPKFPHVTDLLLLLRRGHADRRADFVEAAELTLDRMAAGGIRDHIGGGFARYSVDAQWLVPHFEKMLYDNALLVEAYIRAFQVTGNSRHADVATEILDYLCRDMIDDDGGFHCSEDADSEGVEGKFYVWTPSEVEAVLGADRGERFCRIYDITPDGNFEGKSIPRLLRPIADWADQLGSDTATLEREIANDRNLLFEAREQRVRPGRDDKVLTAWNALAIRSLSLCGGILGQQKYLDAAIHAAEFVLEKMSKPNGRLLHAFRKGQSHLDAYLDDYAYTIDAFLTLFESTGDAVWVDHAIRLADDMRNHFEDTDGGFFYTADDGEPLLTRNKDWHDGSLISGNAAALKGLLHLSRLTNRSEYVESVERTLRLAQDVLSKQSAACGALLSVLDDHWHGREQLVLAVKDRDQVADLRGLFLKSYRPHATLCWSLPDKTKSLPLAQGRNVVGEGPTLYRCQDFSCDVPLEGDETERWLNQP